MTTSHGKTAIPSPGCQNQGDQGDIMVIHGDIMVTGSKILMVMVTGSKIRAHDGVAA